MLEEHLGRRVRTVRLDRGMTQLELARATGHAPKAICNSGRGKGRPYPGTIADVATALRIDLDLLVAEVT